ncbi:UNVERIFIED_ORG: hypothetical protein M2193_004956 [Bradyrhizobium japonicum]|uniref:hypothetical protein n=1 Tax=Bradyrhizobium diazoefficiens TaxID=1355477 RepID=UPI0034875ED9
MDDRAKGAWLLAHSKSLDLVSGPGSARLEKIGYAGKIGRLYNVLRRGSNEAQATSISSATVENLCQLNNIDFASRRDGLGVLKDLGRVDIAADGSIAVLGATGAAVLETTTSIFEESGPSNDERAVLMLSEDAAARPIDRNLAEERISDEFKLKSAAAGELVELCKRTALIDEEQGRSVRILFNSNTFRDKERAAKAYHILQELKPDQVARLTEVEEQLRKSGTIIDKDVEAILGIDVFNRLSSVGYFDRMEVNNARESVGYIALPDAFQKYGRPFEEDPVDDAKALLASLTYGMTRSASSRGRIDLPKALIQALIDGREIGGQWGVTAIGEDYRELERRGVVKVTRVSGARYRMALLKRDVGELALAIIKGGAASEDALLLGTTAATGFKGPDETRKAVRRRNSAEDKAFVASALDRIRGGG